MMLSAFMGGRGVDPLPPSACDPYYDQVLFHLRMAGADGSSVFVDEKGGTVGVGGGAVQSDVQTKFLPTAGAFDGNGDFVDMQGAYGATGFSGVDFTWEGWFYPTSEKVHLMFNKRSALAARGIAVFLDTAGGFRFGFAAGDSDTAAWEAYIQSGVVVANAWYHVAAVRNGSTYLLFVNGALEGSAAWGGAPADDTSQFAVGASAGGTGAITFGGYISDVRITRGVARYTSGFTPPAASFPTTQC